MISHNTPGSFVFQNGGQNKELRVERRHIELENDLKEQLSRSLGQSDLYFWRLRTLSRCPYHFGISYTDYSVDRDEVREVFEKEIKGPGRLLGYR